MKNVIVVPTHRSGLPMLENLLASFRGFDKYPLLIVVNDYRAEDECLFAPLAAKFRELPITLKTLASNSFEFGGLYVAHRETDCEELLLLPHSCEIVDIGLLDIVFQTHRGQSVAFGLQTGNWRTHGIGRKGENERLVLRHLDAAANRELLSLGDVRFWQGHIGKYRRALLDKMRLEDYLPRNIIEAISKSELLFTSRYQALDRDTIVLFPKWVDGAAVEEKFGRKRLKVANKYLIKWKSHWTVDAVFDEAAANERAALPADAPAIVTLTRYPEIFARLRESIDCHDPYCDKVVVTSGGAKVGARGWRVIAGIEPFAFARNVNLAFRAVDSRRDILLVNDDCQLAMPVLKTLGRICREAPAIGVLSPQIDGGVANPAQRLQSRPGDYYLSDERLAFVCVYIPAATRRLVGAMNEAFTGYGGDDDDFCRRVRKAGLELAVTPLVSVKHGFGRRTWSASFSRVMSARRQARSMAEMLRLAAQLAEEEQ